MAHTIIFTEDNSRVEIKTCNDCELVEECREHYYTKGFRVGYCNIMNIYAREVYDKRGYPAHI